MIDLITVVFQQELDYLRTQAESVNLYVPTVNNIYVVVNDDDSVCNLIDIAWWHQHQDKVQIIPRSKWNYSPLTTGWEHQQLLKLLTASGANSQWSMALDAKTWFVKQLDYTELFDSQSRARVGLQNSIPVFQSAREFVEQHYNISMPKIIGPAGVPFMFHTNTVVDMINEFDDFISFFQANVKYPHCITEFYLYSAYVLAKLHDYDTLYNKTPYYSFVNIAEFDVPKYSEHIHGMQTTPNLLTASVHRRAYPLLSDAQKDQWFGFLCSRRINTISTWRYKWHSTSTLQ